MAEDSPLASPTSVSLNSRQVFFVFFGFSVVGCLLFTVGVMVGRKLPSSGGAHVAEVVDPTVPVLDAPAPSPTKDADMAFREGLQQPDPAAANPAPVQPATPAAPAGAPTSASPTSASSGEKVPNSVADVAAKNPPAAANPKADEPVEQGRTYALEVRNFTTAEEADQFAKALQDKGYSARSYVKNPDKDPKHRVIVGGYDSEDAAKSAKKDFEKAERRIAYVVRNPS